MPTREVRVAILSKAATARQAGVMLGAMLEMERR
jgi:hypothetical protein